MAPNLSDKQLPGDPEFNVPLAGAELVVTADPVPSKADDPGYYTGPAFGD